MMRHLKSQVITNCSNLTWISLGLFLERGLRRGRLFPFPLGGGVQKLGSRVQMIIRQNRGGRSWLAQGLQPVLTVSEHGRIVSWEHDIEQAQERHSYHHCRIVTGSKSVALPSTFIWCFLSLTYPLCHPEIKKQLELWWTTEERN